MNEKDEIGFTRNLQEADCIPRSRTAAPSTIREIRIIRDAVKDAYLQALEGKSVSFTGVNGRTFTHHDIRALSAELELWDAKLRNAQRGRSTYSLVNFR